MVQSISCLQAKSRKYPGIQALRKDPQMDGQMPVQYHNLTDFVRRKFFFSLESQKHFLHIEEWTDWLSKYYILQDLWPGHNKRTLFEIQFLSRNTRFLLFPYFIVVIGRLWSMYYDQQRENVFTSAQCFQCWLLTVTTNLCLICAVPSSCPFPANVGRLQYQVCWKRYISVI